ncbi:AbrB/MazE/SpoVT family DNA-binding domain-containing protein [Pseudonocardia sp.]|uniref:AbrB/MazE/SpoVT family DNA-binding domain-containing protein n=1 Tax=Pseudonocardia sp. TaxID=60912 RepID=UPI002636707B|nr:AbrB/MazE/SpoVT family DNA-binding domain-containing protein [Pseudonocardia sp.]
MKLTIDAAGRVVIPKQVRDRLGLTAGSELELDELGDHVELRPAGRDVWIDRSDGRPVARAAADAPRLTADDVRTLVDRQRR